VIVAAVSAASAPLLDDPRQQISLLGAVLQLSVYALMQIGRLQTQSYPYQLANVIGSLLRRWWPV